MQQSACNKKVTLIPVTDYLWQADFCTACRKGVIVYTWKVEKMFNVVNVLQL